MESLRAANEPASAADLVRSAVPDDANGALELRSAYRAIPYEAEATRRFFSDVDDLAGPFTPEQLRALHNMVSENEAALALVKAAMAKGPFDWQIEMKSPLIEVLLPHLAEQRALANVVVGAAIVAQQNGDEELALERLGHQLGIARALAMQPMLVSHLVVCGMAHLEADAFTAILPALESAAGTPARKRTEALIAGLLDESLYQHGLRRAIEGERVVQADTAICIADGRVRPRELFSWIAEVHKSIPDSAETAKQIALEDAAVGVQYLTQVLQAIDAPDWPSVQAKLPQPPAFDADRYFGRGMTPSFGRALESHFRFLASRRLAAAGLAARCYAIDHDGKRPASLAALVPAYLPAVPLDPFTRGEALRYLPEQGVIYSVGLNGVDDRGEHSREAWRDLDVVLRLGR